jgi:polyisoprenoid-binding protein YceI
MQILSEETPDMSDRYEIDPAHSRIGFVARHMMVARVRGHFREFTGFLTAPEGDPTKGEIDFAVKAQSIDTGTADRDNHLRSADFFDAANHPDITFRSTSIEKDGDEYVVKGDLTMRGVTKPVQVRGSVEGTVNDPYGNERIAVGFTGKLNRKEWGLNWNMALETGGVVVGDEIKLELDVTVLRKVPATVA